MKNALAATSPYSDSAGTLNDRATQSGDSAFSFRHAADSARGGRCIKRPNTVRHSTTTLTAIFSTILIWATLAEAQKSISAAEAKDRVGDSATVCGQVASTHFAERSKGEPTFINLDKPYPNQIFTILIWGSDRSKFGDPEEAYRGKQLCVTGTVTLYHGLPEVVAHNPTQISSR